MSPSVAVAFRPKRSIGCPNIVPAECPDTEPVHSGDFDVAFWICLGSSMTSIVPLQGTALDRIVITGSGFVASAECTEVQIGGKPCVVSSVTPTSIECSVDNTAELEVGFRYAVTVNIKSNGFALPLIPDEMNRRFVLLPHFSLVHPSSGSVGGGTQLRINGGGFVDGETQVSVDGTPCEIISLDYAQIKCSMGHHAAGGPYNVSVIVKSIPAECPSNDCVFEYREDLTPHITDVQPSTLSGPGTLAITGTNFGDETAIVRIGNVELVVDSTTDTSIVCTVDNILVGKNTLYVRLPGRGSPVEEFKVTGGAVINDFSPSEGSVAGRTLLTIQGHGFMHNGTAVTIGGDDCVIKTVDMSSLTCEIPPHAVGDVTVNVVSNSVSYPALTFSYTTTATPEVTSISPVEGYVGDTITISGTGFTVGGNEVTVGDAICHVSSSSEGEIQCVAGKQLAGQYAVKVMVSVKGAAVSLATFNYLMTVINISPNAGGS